MTEFDLERAMEQAVQLHQGGDVAGAEAIYRRVLGVAPDDSDALHLLGLITMNSERSAEAIELLRRAIALQPDVAEFHLDLGRALLAHGDPNAAQEPLREAVKLDQTLVDAWFLLGRILPQMGHRQEAVECLRTIVRLVPENADAHRALADVLLTVPDWQGAVAAAQGVVRLKGDDPASFFLLGNALRAAANMEAATAAYERALVLKPDYVEAMLHLASVMWMSARHDEAVRLCRQATTLRPEFAPAHYALGKALEKAGQLDEAARAYEKALQLDPTQVNWRFELAVVSGESPAAPPSDFVASLFDEYASKFDDHLIAGLQYQAPQKLLELVKAHIPHTSLDVMDLGCGTGLCGRLLRPLARSLKGVDLSPRMIELAREAKAYDFLEVGDATESLRSHQSAFDLIVAGDVLVYLGDLASTFQASRRALRPGGWFAFTVEAQDADGFALQRTRRYTHSLAYVETTSAKAGLEKVEARPVVLRTQEQTPVRGYAVLLRRPAAE